jgi:ferric-chelate reductase
MLLDIANKARGSSLDLHIQIFVTCLCDPEAAPVIPNCDVSVEKPKVAQLLEPFLTPHMDVEANGGRGDGGVAVAVSGPESLTCEAQNVIARIPAGRARRVGGLALHTEIFSL